MTVLKRSLLVVGQLALIAVIILLWQVLVNGRTLDPSFFGTPSGTWHTLTTWASNGTLGTQLLNTVRVLLVGFVIGNLIGVILGSIIGLSPFARSVFEPFLIFFNGLPRLILQPLFVVWFGFGFGSKIALIIAVIFVLTTVNVASALEGIDGDLLKNARILGASRLLLGRHVYLPAITLDVFATARASVGFALQAVIVSEFVGSPSGLGYLIVLGQNTFKVDTIWAALVLIVVLSTALDLVIAGLQKRAGRWRPVAFA